MATAITYLEWCLRVALVHSPLMPSEEAKNLHRDSFFSDFRLLAQQLPSSRDAPTLGVETLFSDVLLQRQARDLGYPGDLHTLGLQAERGG